MVYLTSILRNSSKFTAKELYRYLLRECNKLPKDAVDYYKHTVRQSYRQHILESDAERVEQIIQRAVEDAEWIKLKFDPSHPAASYRASPADNTTFTGYYSLYRN